MPQSPRRLPTVVVAVLACLLAVAGGSAVSAAPAAAAIPAAAGDAVVVAVIDSAIQPYHWDYLASKMPQAGTAAALPLDQRADTWLPGMTATPALGVTHFGRLDINIAGAQVPGANPDTLATGDAAVWNSMKASQPGDVELYWIPGTKVIATAFFGSDGSAASVQGPTSEHGVGTTTTSVGNLHGTCPECLLVFLGGDYETALNWALRQPWIDAISNSYGNSTAVVARDRVYNGSDVELQRTATKRGQAIFFSAGNGVENAFTVSNSTLLSSQEGPDWLITVGAINSSDLIRFTPDGGPELVPDGPGGSPNHGRPADVSGIGDTYPDAYGATTVDGTGPDGFGGTSNATPQLAGTYARALWDVRTAMPGPSRAQQGGVVSIGGASCGSVRPTCELADGVLTQRELRARLVGAAFHTFAGTSPNGLITVSISEDDLYNFQGYGALIGRRYDTAPSTTEWDLERAKIVEPLFGRAAASTHDPDEADYIRVVSWCRQQIWGTWDEGEWNGGALAPVSVSWPTRTAILQACPTLMPPPHDAYLLYSDDVSATAYPGIDPAAGYRANAAPEAVIPEAPFAALLPLGALALAAAALVVAKRRSAAGTNGT